MNVLLSIDMFLQVGSEEKSLRVFNEINKEFPNFWKLIKVEKYWKDDKIYVISLETEWKDDSHEKIVLQCMHICDSFSHQWRMAMPETENSKILRFEGIANAEMPLRHKGKGVQFLRFTLEAKE